MCSLHSGMSVEDLKKLTEMRLHGKQIECDLQISPEDALQIVRARRQEKESHWENYSGYAYPAASNDGYCSIPFRVASNYSPDCTVPVSTSNGVYPIHNSISIVSEQQYEVPYSHVSSDCSPLTPCNSIILP